MPIDSGIEWLNNHTLAERLSIQPTNYAPQDLPSLALRLEGLQQRKNPGEKTVVLMRRYKHIYTEIPEGLIDEENFPDLLTYKPVQEAANLGSTRDNLEQLIAQVDELSSEEKKLFLEFLELLESARISLPADTFLRIFKDGERSSEKCFDPQAIYEMGWEHFSIIEKEPRVDLQDVVVIPVYAEMEGENGGHLLNKLWQLSRQRQGTKSLANELGVVLFINNKKDLVADNHPDYQQNQQAVAIGRYLCDQGNLPEGLTPVQLKIIEEIKASGLDVTTIDLSSTGHHLLKMIGFNLKICIFLGGQVLYMREKNLKN